MSIGYTAGSGFFDSLGNRGGVNLTWPTKKPSGRRKVQTGFIGRPLTAYTPPLTDSEKPLTTRELQDRDQERWDKQYGLNEATLKLRQDQYDYTKEQQELNRKNRELATKEAVRTIAEGYQNVLDEWRRDSGQVAADIRSDYRDQSAVAMQRLARLGMGNTTIAPTLKLGYDREKIASLNRWNDLRSKDKSNILQNRIKDYLSVYNSSGYQSGGE